MLIPLEMCIRDSLSKYVNSHEKKMQTKNIPEAPSLTAYIRAKNEEHSIERCIRALSWCPKVVVSDTGSTDNTKEIAKSLGCEVIDVKFDGFGTTRNRILDHITSDWIVCFDADEVCTPELAEEILDVLKNPTASAYLADVYKRQPQYIVTRRS